MQAQHSTQMPEMDITDFSLSENMHIEHAGNAPCSACDLLNPMIDFAPMRLAPLVEYSRHASILPVKHAGSICKNPVKKTVTFSEVIEIDMKVPEIKIELVDVETAG